jgi:hypothetical protein
LQNLNEGEMMRELILLAAIILFFTSCSSSSVKKELTAEEESRLIVDMAGCKEKADASTRGFGQGGITWERKHKEIYDYCLKSKGWDVD